MTRVFKTEDACCEKPAVACAMVVALARAARRGDLDTEAVKQILLDTQDVANQLLGGEMVYDTLPEWAGDLFGLFVPEQPESHMLGQMVDGGYMTKGGSA